MKTLGTIKRVVGIYLAITNKIGLLLENNLAVFSSLLNTSIPTFTSVPTYILDLKPHCFRSSFKLSTSLFVLLNLYLHCFSLPSA